MVTVGGSGHNALESCAELVLETDWASYFDRNHALGGFGPKQS